MFSIYGEYAKIKKIKHLEYLKKTWMPTFVASYKKQHHSASLIIATFLKEQLLPDDILNMPDDTINNIPGKYRKRLLIETKNLNNTVSKATKVTEAMKVTEATNVTTNTKVTEAMKVTKVTEENIIEDNDGFEVLSNDVDELICVDDSMNVNLDDELIICDPELNKAIQMSLDALKYVTSGTSVTTTTMVKFYICIDLSVYGPNPLLPIHINSSIYYLNNKQQKIVKNLWVKVNDNLQYDQVVEYYKAMAIDLETLSQKR